MFTKIVASLLLTGMLLVGAENQNGDKLSDKSSCCVKNAYCCHIKNSCCHRGSSSDESNALVTEIEAVTSQSPCCARHADCCQVVKSCCENAVTAADSN